MTTAGRNKYEKQPTEIYPFKNRLHQGSCYFFPEILKQLFHQNTREHLFFDTPLLSVRQGIQLSDGYSKTYIMQNGYCVKYRNFT